MGHMIGDQPARQSCYAIVPNLQFLHVSEAADCRQFPDKVAVSQIAIAQLNHSACARHPQTAPLIVIGQTLALFRIRDLRDRAFAEEIWQSGRRHRHDTFSPEVAHTLRIDCFGIKLPQKLLDKFDIFLQFEEFLLGRVVCELAQQFGNGRGGELGVVAFCELTEQATVSGKLGKVELVDPLLQSLFILSQSLQVVSAYLGITLAHLTLELIHYFPVAFALLDSLLQGRQRQEVVVDGLIACLAAADAATSAPLPLRNALILSHCHCYNLQPTTTAKTYTNRLLHLDCTIQIEVSWSKGHVRCVCLHKT